MRLSVSSMASKRKSCHIIGCKSFLIPTAVHISIDRIEYKGKCWEDFARDMLKRAREEDSIFRLFGNSWEIEKEKEKDWQALEDLFKEMKT